MKNMHVLCVVVLGVGNFVWAMENREEKVLKRVQEMQFVLERNDGYYVELLPENLKEELEKYVQEPFDNPKINNWLLAQVPDQKLVYMGDGIKKFIDDKQSNEYMCVEYEEEKKLARKIFDLKKECALGYIGDDVESYAVSSDGQHISVVFQKNAKKVAKIFNLKTQKQLEYFYDTMYAAKFSPDGRYVYAQCDLPDYRESFFDLNKGRELNFEIGRSSMIALFSPNSRYAFVDFSEAGHCNRKLFDLENERVLETHYEQLGNVWFFFSPTGRYYFCEYLDQEAFVYDFKNQTQLKWIGDEVKEVVFDSNEQYIFVKNKNNSSEILDLKKKEKINFHNNEALRLSENGDYLFAQYDKEGELASKVFEFPSFKEIDLELGQNINSVVLDDRYLQLSYADGKVRKFDLKQQQELSDKIEILELSPNQKNSLYAYEDRLEILDNRTMDILKTYINSEEDLGTLHYDADGNIYFLRDGAVHKIILNVDELLDARSLQELKLIADVYQKSSKFKDSEDKKIELDKRQRTVLNKLPGSLQAILQKFVVLKHEQEN